LTRTAGLATLNLFCLLDKGGGFFRNKVEKE